MYVSGTLEPQAPVAPAQIQPAIHMHLKHKLKNPVISPPFECKHHSATIEESTQKVYS
jgi:hypothetical protein